MNRMAKYKKSIEVYQDRRVWLKLNHSYSSNGMLKMNLWKSNRGMIKSITWKKMIQTMMRKNIISWKSKLNNMINCLRTWGSEYKLLRWLARESNDMMLMRLWCDFVFKNAQTCVKHVEYIGRIFIWSDFLID